VDGLVRTKNDIVMESVKDLFQVRHVYWKFSSIPVPVVLRKKIVIFLTGSLKNIHIRLYSKTMAYRMPVM
jgi:hypothetical protein